MKKDIHPAYQKVLFVDSASGFRFVCGSTLKTEAKETFEGVEYPVCYLSISSASHPFFTGSKQLVDAEGRVEKFKRRFERKKEAAKEETPSEEKESEGKEAQQESSAPKKKPAAEKKTAKAPKKS